MADGFQLAASIDPRRDLVQPLRRDRCRAACPLRATR